MKIGYCAALEKAGTLREIGYDFIEPRLLSYPLVDRATLAAAEVAVSRSELPILAFGSFFPYDMRLVGPAVDERSVKDYLARAAALTSAAGASVAALGSAWSRNVPPGWDRSRARAQLLEAYSWAADAFTGSGVTLAIEPQNRKETNIILSIEEAVAYAAQVDSPVLKVMADFYHMDEEGEPLENLRTYADWIVHVQLADTGRKRPGTGSYDYDTFFGYLKEGGYTGAVSIEIADEIPAPDMRRSYEFLRRFWPAG
jgi:sugar phosphate isomerase/epimerase